MADIRHCDQCGRAFEPRREHARFCSAPCRVAWNREHRRDPATELRALDWSVAGLAELAPRLAALSARRPGPGGGGGQRGGLAGHDRGRHADQVLPGRVRRGAGPAAPSQRRLIEGTMAGLRFVRNRMRSEAERDAFICAPAAVEPSGAGAGRAVHLAAGARAEAGLAAGRPPDVGAEPGTRPTRTSWPDTRSTRPSAGRPSSCGWPPRRCPPGRGWPRLPGGERAYWAVTGGC